MAPTREIAVQGSRAIIDVSRPAMTELRVASFIGGISLAEDEAKLKSKKKCPHVAVGTPGRLVTNRVFIHLILIITREHNLAGFTNSSRRAR